MFDWLTGGSQQRQGQYATNQAAAGQNQVSFDQYQAQRGLQAEQQAGYGQAPQFGFMGLGNPQTMDHYAAALGLPTSGEMQVTYQNGMAGAEPMANGGVNQYQQGYYSPQQMSVQNSPAQWGHYRGQQYHGQQYQGQQFQGYRGYPAEYAYNGYEGDGYPTDYAYDQSYGSYQNDGYYYEDNTPTTVGAHYTKRQKSGFLGIGSPSNEQMEAAIGYLNKHFNRADDTGERDKYVTAGEILAYANEIRDKRPNTAKALDELSQYVPQLMMTHIANGDEAWNGLGKKDLALIAEYLKNHDFDELLAATQPLTSGGDVGNQLKVS
jgi:hypothetical protein